MAHPDAERLQAYFDSELDAASAAEVERHIDICEECQAQLSELTDIKNELRNTLAYHRASPNLRARILGALPRDKQANLFNRAREFWLGAVGGIAATGVAAAFAVSLMVPPAADLLTADLANAHIRSLLSDHLIDVASSDHHTVKPWFATHADVSPPVRDLSAEGFALVGGRMDYVDGYRASVVVYRHGAHVINVFAWAAQGAVPARSASRNGYRIVCWRNGDLDFCAVSDASQGTIGRLVALIMVPSAE